MKLAPAPHPEAVLNPQIAILERLFLRHPWAWILARRPSDDGRPKWYTSKYKMPTAKLLQYWQSAAHLIGVSFDKETSYAVLDVDKDSFYCNSEGIKRIRAALETIGITRTILIRSSHSNGLHLYIPLPEAVSTFNLAVALKKVLEDEGHVVKAGILEIFPNVKRYAPRGEISLYKAHRLPLQPGSGSYILDDSLNPIEESLEVFVTLWHSAAIAQDMDMLQQALLTSRSQFDEDRKKQRHSRTWGTKQKATATSILDDHYCWTGKGQTNFLLGRFAWFGRNCLGFTGQALVDYIVDRARQSPGYEQYCGHQRNIQIRARDWAKCAERWASQGSLLRQDKDKPTVNQNVLKAEESQKRICQAMKCLRQENRLPEPITKRLVVLEKEFGICRAVLYKNKPWWHPKFLVEVASADLNIVEQTNAESETISQELDKCPKPLPEKGFEKFYTRPYMKLFAPGGGKQKVNFGRSNFPATRNQAFHEATRPEKEKIEPEGGAKRPSQGTRSLPIALPQETSLHRSPEPPLGGAPFAPLAHATSSRGLTQLALVPGAEVSAATPEQLTEQLRTLQRPKEPQRLQTTSHSSRNISSV